MDASRDPPRRRRLWRSFAERSDAVVAEARTPEFPPGVDQPPDLVARREFFRLAAAGAALAAATGCERAPRGVIRPYVVDPETVIPGNPLFYATSITTRGYASGLLVESHEGRPTKIEGNPSHPASLGATTCAAQASLLDVYDPDRALAVMRGGEPSSWSAFDDAFVAPARAGGVHLLLPSTSSPVVADQIRRLRARLGDRIDVRWYDALPRMSAWEGARLAFGTVLEARLALREAKVAVAFDADFLSEGPASLALARAFADGRRLAEPSATMNRLYVAEPAVTVTGMSADHRLRVRARDIASLAALVATELATAGAPLPRSFVDTVAPLAGGTTRDRAWARAVARDLAANAGAGVVVAGDGQPPFVHALAHAVNDALGNAGRTVTYAPSPIVDAGTDAFDLAPLAAALDAGHVERLIVLGGNPAYGAPADLELGRRLRKAMASAYLGRYVDETAAACQWFLPATHYLEEWGDARAFDGTISVIQPLLGPAGDARSTIEVLAALLGDLPATPHEILTRYWTQSSGAAERETSSWVEQGIVASSAAAPITPAKVSYDALIRAGLALTRYNGEDALEICFRPDARAPEGAAPNNAWLLELPDPTTRLTWGNAARLSRATATRLGVTDGDVLRLDVGSRSVLAPVLVVPGHADGTIALAIGYGRAGTGEQIVRGVGVNAGTLRTRDAPWFGPVVAARTGAREGLALEQVHSSLEGRDDDVLLHRSLASFRNDPGFATDRAKTRLALYDLKPAGARQWGMVIDLNACTGCATCVVACQAENNIPAVGKAGVAKGRAMHWIRIDRYFFGEEDDPGVLLEPMLCQHCEKAPCEYVCPVNATTHSSEGLNQMTYNRCVGTRFCSNNCPYKVRRFNWFNYQQGALAGAARVHNPDVTVRARGVMEKCTYCVQRIREAEIRSEVAGRPLRDGDVVVACEQACPTRAITFGDIADPASRVSALRTNVRRFSVLNDLGTAPRTQYLARITNPNPELA